MTRSLGVTVLGDLDALAERVESAPPVAAGAAAVLPVDAGVQAVMSVIDASREKPTSRDLASQLWRRTKAQSRDKLRLGGSVARQRRD